MNTLTLMNLAPALLLLWQRLRDARRRRRRDRAELDTLAHLGERDLHDLGLSRSDLPRLLRHHGVTHTLAAGAGGDPRWS